MAPRRAERRITHVTKADVARQHIQELILAGRARAGDRLTTGAIAAALAMSETPIREAMRSLAAEGWLDFHPHLGVVVASIRAEQLREVYALRGALGALAIELCGAAYPPERLAAIDRALDESAAAVARDDIDGYARLNRDFHRLLSDTPSSPLTLKQLAALWAQTAAARRGFDVIPGRIAASLAEHRAIRAAIGRRDAASAAALLIAHERGAGDALIAALAAVPATG